MTDLDTFGEIRQIRSRLDAIEHSQDVLVRAQAKEILAQALAAFLRDDLLARVYLLVDGNRTQQEIGAAMQEQGLPGDKAAIVSRELDVLNNALQLVVQVDQAGKGKVYRKTREDRLLGITRQLEKQRASRAKVKGEGPQPAGS